MGLWAASRSHSQYLVRSAEWLSKSMEKVCAGMDPTPGFDSHSSPHYSEWFLINADHCCPSHVLTMEAFIAYGQIPISYIQPTRPCGITRRWP